MNQRRPSNKVKQRQYTKQKLRQLETKFLQEQTKKMQERLSQLKKQVQEQKQLKAASNLQSTVTRWKKNTRSDAPLKSYAKQILQQQKQAYKKFGIDQKKITGTKTFVKISIFCHNIQEKQLKQQKQQQQQKNPTKIPSLMSKTSFLRQKKAQQSIQSVEKVQIIQDNFFKAKMDIKNLIKQKTVLQFLQQIFLQQYFALFQQNNITQLSDLRFLTKEQLQQMSIPKGHQVKILKRIKQQFQKNKSPSKILNKNLQQKFLQKQKQQPQKGKLVQMGYGDADINQYEKFQQQQKQIELQQNFDEVKSQQAQEEDQYAEYQNNVVLITVPLCQMSLQTGEQNEMDEMAQSIVQNCFNCYKNIPLKHQLFNSPDKRNFCSANCLRLYQIQMQKSCPQCGNNFFKIQGFYEQGLWFCSIQCCPNQQDIEQMFLQWARKCKK